MSAEANQSQFRVVYLVEKDPVRLKMAISKTFLSDERVISGIRGKRLSRLQEEENGLELVEVFAAFFRKLQISLEARRKNHGSHYQLSTSANSFSTEE